ncbi:MAG: PQQ-binding-like beta-propeller repeat protein [bacterium]|nr:PQQ-binding-like beta-propeller repeat protein [bacterium]
MQTDDLKRQEPLRLWPGVVIVLLQWLVKLGAPIVVTGDATAYEAFAGLFGVFALVVWWAFFSRAHLFERWGAVVLMIVALIATPNILHESIRAGAVGFQFYIYAIPVLNLAFVAWAVASRRLADGPRRAAMAATILLACGAWALVRSDGITGDGAAELAWRWSENYEEQLLARTGDESEKLPSAPAAVESGAGRPAPDRVARAWPGFRGAARNGHVPGTRIETDWSASAPVELWRRKVGPGWSSFAVRGDLLYTQEQRGDDEVVACYDATTGEPVWRHRDAARFWQSESGAGPLATPTLADDRVYTLGATGILNALDAGDGSVVWSRDAASDTGAQVPHWGFTGSPLVTGDLVVVAVSGTLVAYDLATGEPRWYGPDGGVSYSSPHLLTIAEVAQVLMPGGARIVSVAPADGVLLWDHPWPGSSIVQPAQVADGDILISRISVAGLAIGTRRIKLARGPGGWTTEERWTSNRLKPHSSDFVVHDGHAFGFDGRILACIDVEDGERKWKGGRYGSGQLVLLPDQDLLLVVSERGELALVSAAPDRFTEVARTEAIEGKSWSHPVLVGDLLLVRNAREMAAFRLALAGD